MSTRMETILANARYSLADASKSRYSDERLISLISDAQRDIARNTRLLKAEVTLPLNSEQPTYDLPDDVWLITRATFGNTVIPLTSHDRLDARCLSWYTQYGNAIDSIVYDRRDMLKIRVYPIPGKDFFSENYTFVSDNPLVQDPNGLVQLQLDAIYAAIAQLQLDALEPTLPLANVYEQASNILNVQPGLNEAVFGVVTSVDGVVATPIYGVMTDIDLADSSYLMQLNVLFDTDFGVVTNIQDSLGLLHLYYIKDPKIIQFMSDKLELAPIFDRALTLYTVGMAFADDLDTQNQERSASALALYKRELDTVGTPTDFTDGTRAAQYTPNYTTAFGN